MIKYGKIREDYVAKPVSGRAIPVYKGEVLRVTLTEGAQTVDFNAYNLHDYKERLDVGRTRLFHGMFPKSGDMLWTASPRDRPMYVILEMPETCKSETLGARCHALLFEVTLGYGIHTNCQDTLAECIREWGLTPDDTHDSFNMWMNTEIDKAGNMALAMNTGRRGDHVDLLALFDTLAVPITCGAGDVDLCSNFKLKPIRVQVFEPSTGTRKLVKQYQKKWMSFRNQRAVKDFAIKNIKTDRELKRDPNYRPNFINYPIKYTRIPIELNDTELKYMEEIKKRGEIPGEKDGDLVRSVFMLWYLTNRLRPIGAKVQFGPLISSNLQNP